MVFQENLRRRRHGNMFEQGLATTDKFKNTRLQPSRARALTESLGALADTHHSFRLASSVPRQGPGTRVHDNALWPRAAVIITRPAASVVDHQIGWLTKRQKPKPFRGSEGTRPLYRWKADEVSCSFIHFLET